MTEMLDRIRPINDRERAVIDFLLDAPFLGRDQLKRQLATARVNLSRSYEARYIHFLIDPGTEPVPDETTQSVPVEAEGRDIDGELIWVLLHVDADGRAQELDVMRANGDPALVYPSPESLTRCIREIEGSGSEQEQSAS